jgi:hypothetical protein
MKGLPMNTLFDSSRPVKPASSFGRDVFPDRSERRMPYTAADLLWAAQTLNEHATDYDVVGPSDTDFDFAAGCALAEARMSAGFPLF